MSYIVFNQFGGIAPINDKHKLPPPHGQQAVSCKFEGGNVRAVKAPTEVDISYPFQDADTATLFHISARQWLRWIGDVSVVRGPQPQDQDYLGLGDDYRILYAGDTGDFPQWPRFTTKFRAMGNADPESWFEEPALKYPLGVPPPQSVPQVSPSSAPSGELNTITKGNPVVCSGVEPHGLINAARVRMGGALPTTGDGSELINNEYAVSVVTSTSFKLDSVDGSEWEANLSGAFTWTRVYADQELEDRIYVSTLVNEFGEEGAPSGASSIVQVGPGQYVVVTTDADSSVVVGDSPIFVVTKKRIYRSVTGTAQLNYQFVAEVDISDVSYDDTVDVGSLGEILPTEEYALPPANLEGLCVHPNGYLLGFVGNELFLSEPNLPYAWPNMYRKTLGVERIVSILTYGANVVVLTNNDPYIGFATDPASLSLKGAEQTYPCVHRQAAVSTGYSVVYVSPVGLIAFDASGPRVLTEDYYNTNQWKDLIGFSAGSRCALAWQDGKVWMSVERKVLVSFDIAKPGRMDIVIHPVLPVALGVRKQSDELYVMRGGDFDSFRRLWLTNASHGDNANYTWESGSQMQGRPINFGWCQIFAPDYVDNGQPITLTVTTEYGPQVYTVTTGAPFRLRPGFLAKQWAAKVFTNGDIKAIHMAEHCDELEEIRL